MLHNTFFWKLDPHPPLHNANNVEPYTFATLFSGKFDTPPHHHLRYVTLEWPLMNALFNVESAHQIKWVIRQLELKVLIILQVLQYHDILESQKISHWGLTGSTLSCVRKAVFGG